MSSPIVLTTLNATYQHCAFGLRYLLANLEELQPQAKIVEFTISQNGRDIVESLLAENPKVVGFGVYIWNTRQTEEVVSLLKRVRPEVQIVLGGPEVSFESDGQRVCSVADYVIQGEGEFLFRNLARQLLSGQGIPPNKFIAGELPGISQLKMPYQHYEAEDIQNRIIYVEASRGCPYKCEFCLSSLDKSVRNFPLDAFLNEMQALLDKGVRQFKFVDRTFNLSIGNSTRILRFFLERISMGLFLHFEMVPDRLPLELRDLLTQFPEGSLQFEVGIQTWNHDVGRLVSRKQDDAKVVDNFSFLRSNTKVHIHADLIVGLPGETLESFGLGFDKTVALAPHEVQVGILKRLKGTPIIRHNDEWEMVYQQEPPFTVLKTKTMGYADIQALSRFAKFWDLYANRGHFPQFMQRLIARAAMRETPSLFWEFYEFSAYLNERHPQRHSIALVNLVESAWLYLTRRRGEGEEEVRSALVMDYTGRVSRDVPAFLRESGETVRSQLAITKSATPKRQQRISSNKIQHIPPFAG